MWYLLHTSASYPPSIQSIIHTTSDLSMGRYTKTFFPEHYTKIFVWRKAGANHGLRFSPCKIWDLGLAIWRSEPRGSIIPWNT
mmetsp:Transcript_23485/g.38599  ORF Transcript_23485/g.38599 Transcript_23485/m.38599 type:complete len:83 (+) Transcript_23485:21-269(+)